MTLERTVLKTLEQNSSLISESMLQNQSTG